MYCLEPRLRDEFTIAENFQYHYLIDWLKNKDNHVLQFVISLSVLNSVRPFFREALK